MDGGMPTPATIKEHVLSVSSATGTVVGFDELAKGFSLLAAGQKVTYSGAAGSYVLNTLGDSILNRGAIWRIQGGDFVTLDHEQCDSSELQNGGW
jgi:hypothetical protein